MRELFQLAEAEILILWQQMLANGEDALQDLLPELIATFGLAAASVAADFYEEVREQEDVKKRFSPIIEEPKDFGARQLISWALATSEDDEKAKTKIIGGTQRRVVNQARNVITLSSIADPSAKGWMRIGGGACGFCAMLISRGAVYTEKSVEFASHDHCGCSAAPAFNSVQIKNVAEEFVPSARKRSEETLEADRKRVKEWIAANLPKEPPGPAPGS